MMCRHCNEVQKGEEGKKKKKHCTVWVVALARQAACPICWLEDWRVSNVTLAHRESSCYPSKPETSYLWLGLGPMDLNLTAICMRACLVSVANMEDWGNHSQLTHMASSERFGKFRAWQSGTKYCRTRFLKKKKKKRENKLPSTNAVECK